MEPLPCRYHTFGSVESNRQEVQRLQQAQLEYGVYACIPGTQHTYEEMIQSLVGLDLRRQCEERRQRNHTYEPKRHQTIKAKRRNQKETPDKTRERAIQQDVWTHNHGAQEDHR
ncbi:hypothetical protein [Ktedonobacter robiniae]|uniref:Uncharacterized protein n=1 Tax=Ktedonobacter robiniae TaxID=2778365 RepID=A0ABQ3UZR1_9CHLR|nr:hypothetical protein [Ktedonobacter robiniae]GHO58376.1 hypothetical protein KSB_68510 [Ktedonobacter robiniae]